MIVGSLNEITILIRISYWRVGSLKESCLFFGVNFPISTSNLPFGFSLLSTCIELVEIADALEMNLILRDKDIDSIINDYKEYMKDNEISDKDIETATSYVKPLFNFC